MICEVAAAPVRSSVAPVLLGHTLPVVLREVPPQENLADVVRAPAAQHWRGTEVDLDKHRVDLLRAYSNLSTQIGPALAALLKLPEADPMTRSELETGGAAAKAERTPSKINYLNNDRRVGTFPSSRSWTQSDSSRLGCPYLWQLRESEPRQAPCGTPCVSGSRAHRYQAGSPTRARGNLAGSP